MKLAESQDAKTAFCTEKLYSCEKKKNKRNYAYILGYKEANRKESVFAFCRLIIGRLQKIQVFTPSTKKCSHRARRWVRV